MIRRKQLTEDEAIARLETLCARSERSTFEALQKLRQWGISDSASRKIVQLLTEERFIDDARFARSYVNDKLRFSGWGRIKIKLNLRAKRIADDIVADALAAVDEEEYVEVLERIIGSKASRMTDLDTYEGRTRLYRWGLSRGFESPLVAVAVKKAAQMKS